MQESRVKRQFRPTRVVSGAQVVYRQWKEWDEGDQMVYILRGHQKNRKNPARNDWIVECLECYFEDFKKGKALKGKMVLLNSAGQFDKGMEQLETGETARVTYNGCQVMQGGPFKGKEAHLMTVEVVEEGSEDEGDDSLDEESGDEQDDTDFL